MTSERDRAGGPAPNRARRTLEVLTGTAGFGVDRVAVARSDEQVLVGRDAEVAQLRAALEAAKAARGTLFLVSGEPGIGKTRLAEELLGQATALGVLPLRARCWEGGGAPAYWPWIQLLRSYVAHRADDDTTAAQALLDHIQGPVDSVGVAGDPDTGRFHLLDALVTAAVRASRRQPLAVVVDDVHAADESSVAALQLLAGQIRDAAMVVLVTYREAEVRAAPSLARSLAELRRDGRHLALSGLDTDGVGTLIAERTGEPAPVQLAEAVREATGGNPFFIDQVVRLLDLKASFEAGVNLSIPVPEQVREAVRWRLEPLSPRVRHVLDVAAIVGREFDFGLVTTAAGVDVEEAITLLDSAVVAGLVTPAGRGQSRFEFVHSLVRETLYEDLAPADRMRTHRLVAELLERRMDDGDESHAAEVAHHYVASAPLCDVDRAIAACRRAAARARRVYAYADAAELYEQVLELLASRGADASERCAALLDLGTAQRSAGDTPAARRTFEQAAEAAEIARSPEQLALAALGFGMGLGGYGFVDRADEALIAILERGLDALATEDSVLRVRMLARLAVELYYTPLSERRDELSAEALAMAERLGDSEALLVAAYSRHWSMLGPDDLDARAAVADQLVTLALRVGDLEMALRGHHLRLTAALELGDIVAADEALDRYARVTEQLRQPLYRWHLATLRSMRAFITGDFAESERLAYEALDHGNVAQGDTATLLFGVQLCSVRWMQGRMGEVEPAVRLFVEQYPWSAWRPALAIATAELGRLEETRALFDRMAVDDFGKLPRDGNWLTMLCHLTLPCAALGDAERAEALLDLLRPYAHRIVVANAGAVCYGSVATFCAVLATTAGRDDEARELFEAGLFDNLAVGHRPLATWTLLQQGLFLLRSRNGADRERGREIVGEAAVWAAELGMDGAVATARAAVKPQQAQDANVEAARLFRREGDYWTVVFDGGVSRLKDGKGPRYLAQLLANPGTRIPALNLVLEGGAATASAVDTLALASDGTASAGALLDAKAKAAYEQRLRDLYADLDEAQSYNDPERAARIEDEIDALMGELRRAVGLGGRDRMAASPAERARISVTKLIKQTVRRLAEDDPALGAHLQVAVRTGALCAYLPDHGAPRWQT